MRQYEKNAENTHEFEVINFNLSVSKTPSTVYTPEKESKSPLSIKKQFCFLFTGAV